jgi:hypothetical protein
MNPIPHKDPLLLLLTLYEYEVSYGNFDKRLKITPLPINTGIKNTITLNLHE